MNAISFEVVDRFHVWIAAISFKKLIIISVTLGGTLAASLERLFSNQWGSAGLAGVIGSMFSIILLLIPRVMEQRRKTRESNHTIREDTADKIIERYTELYQQQLRNYTRELQNVSRALEFHRQISAIRDVIALLERKSKHRVLSQLTGAELVIQELADQLKDANLVPKEIYTRKTYEDLAGDQDNQIVELKRKIMLLAAETNVDPIENNENN